MELVVPLRDKSSPDSKFLHRSLQVRKKCRDVSLCDVAQCQLHMVSLAKVNEGVSETNLPAALIKGNN